VNFVNVFSPININKNQFFCSERDKKMTTYLLLHKTPTQKQPDAKKIVDMMKNRVGKGISPAER
jgi:hypothetical protein